MLHRIAEHIAIHCTCEEIIFLVIFRHFCIYYLEFKSKLFTVIMSQDKKGDWKADIDSNLVKSLQMIFK